LDKVEVRQFKSKEEALKVAKELSKRPDVKGVVVRRSGRIEIHYKKPVKSWTTRRSSKRVSREDKKQRMIEEHREEMERALEWASEEHFKLLYGMSKEEFRKRAKIKMGPREALEKLKKGIEKAPESTRKAWIRALAKPKEGTVQYIKTPHGYAKLKYEGGKWRYYPPGSKIATHEVSFSLKRASPESIQKQLPSPQSEEIQGRIKQTKPPTTTKVLTSYEKIGQEDLYKRQKEVYPLTIKLEELHERIETKGPLTGKKDIFSRFVRGLGHGTLVVGKFFTSILEPAIRLPKWLPKFVKEVREYRKKYGTGETIKQTGRGIKKLGEETIRGFKERPVKSFVETILPSLVFGVAAKRIQLIKWKHATPKTAYKQLIIPEEAGKARVIGIAKTKFLGKEYPSIYAGIYKQLGEKRGVALTGIVTKTKGTTIKTLAGSKIITQQTGETTLSASLSRFISKIKGKIFKGYEAGKFVTVEMKPFYLTKGITLAETGQKGFVAGISKVYQPKPKFTFIVSPAKTSAQTLAKVGQETSLVIGKVVKRATKPSLKPTPKALPLPLLKPKPQIAKQVSGFASPVIDIVPREEKRVILRKPRIDITSIKAFGAFLAQRREILEKIKRKRAEGLKRRSISRRRGREAIEVGLKRVTGQVNKIDVERGFKQVELQLQKLVQIQIPKQRVVEISPVWLSPRVYPGIPFVPRVVKPYPGFKAKKKKRPWWLGYGLRRWPILAKPEEIAKALGWRR